MSAKRHKLIRKLARLEAPEDAKTYTKLVKKYKQLEYTPSYLQHKLDEGD